MPPPRAREPVSPMKILAGEAFHQRNPKQAPMTAGGDHRQVVRVAHLVALGPGVRWQFWLNCQMPMST